MATVTGVTAERAQEIEDAAIVGAKIQGNDLIFTTGDGTQINAGRIIQPAINNWPVGSIFLNTSSTSPATLLGGGTWVRWGKGRMPVSVDEAQTEFATVEKTGGEKTHLLTVAEMPKHSHGGATGYHSADHTHAGYTSSYGDHQHSTPAHTHPGIQVNGYFLEWKDATRQAGTLAGMVTSGDDPITVASGGGGTSGAAGAHSHTVQTYGASTNHYHSITQEGGGTAHNVLNPYITVYMWKRTA